MRQGGQQTETHNNGMNSDLKKLALFQTGYTKRCRGRCASSTIAADEHPQAARRFAPHNQRMQQSIPSAN